MSTLIENLHERSSRMPEFRTEWGMVAGNQQMAKERSGQKIPEMQQLIEHLCNINGKPSKERGFKNRLFRQGINCGPVETLLMQF